MNWYKVIHQKSKLTKTGEPYSVKIIEGLCRRAGIVRGLSISRAGKTPSEYIYYLSFPPDYEEIISSLLPDVRLIPTEKPDRESVILLAGDESALN